MVRREFEVIEDNAVRLPYPGVTTEEERVERLVALGRALSDPIRVRMLGLMAAAAVEGRGCCELPERGVPADVGGTEVPGICVCEFEDYFGMGQSKVSYHVRRLKEAGLVHEEKRGKWSFYSLDRENAQALLDQAADHLGTVLLGRAGDV